MASAKEILVRPVEAVDVLHTEVSVLLVGKWVGLLEISSQSFVRPFPWKPPSTISYYFYIPWTSHEYGGFMGREGRKDNYGPWQLVKSTNTV